MNLLKKHIDIDEKVIREMLEKTGRLQNSIVSYYEIIKPEENISVVKPSVGKFQGKEMVILEHYCINPACDCRSAHIYLSYIKEYVHFNINFDTEKLSYHQDEHFSEEDKIIAEEFMRDAYENYKIQLLTHYNEAKEFGRKILDFIVALDNFSNGEMVYFCNAFGDTIPWSFTHLNRTYKVLDYYCAKTYCNCQDIRLTFFEKDKNKVGKMIFSIDLDQDLNYEQYEPSWHYPEMEQIVSSFFKTFPELSNELSNRYRKIKKFGSILSKNPISESEIKKLYNVFNIEKRAYKDIETLPKPEITKVKVGRNDPCPCGSGKKYKKCCLGK